MKKKVFTSIMVCAMMISVLGACGAEEIRRRDDKAEMEKTEDKEREKGGLFEILPEDEEQVLTLEAKHIFYTTSGEFERSQETEYDVFGNPIWQKSVQDKGVQSSLAVGEEERKQDLRETESTYKYEYDGSNIVEYVASSTNGESTRGEREYDEADNLVQESVYGSDDSLKYEYVYKYDRHGNLVREEYYTADGCAAWREWAYDEKENLISEEYYVAERRVSWKEWLYDDNGNELKYVEYIDPKAYGIQSTLSAVIPKAEEYEYDGSGNLVKEIHYRVGMSGDMTDEKKEICDWFEYEYDTSDMRIKEMKYNADGFMDEWSHSEYDEDGNATKITVYNSNDTMMYWTEYGYDTYGNMTKQTRYRTDGSVSVSTQYRHEYDTQGNKIKYIEYGSGGEVAHQEEWKYDENSNLVEYIKYREGVMLEQVEYVTIIVE